MRRVYALTLLVRWRGKKTEVPRRKYAKVSVVTEKKYAMILWSVGEINIPLRVGEKNGPVSVVRNDSLPWRTAWPSICSNMLAHYQNHYDLVHYVER